MRPYDPTPLVRLAEVALAAMHEFETEAARAPKGREGMDPSGLKPLVGALLAIDSKLTHAVTWGRVREQMKAFLDREASLVVTERQWAALVALEKALRAVRAFGKPGIPRTIRTVTLAWSNGPPNFKRRPTRLFTRALKLFGEADGGGHAAAWRKAV
jgi:hypothetical protein